MRLRFLPALIVGIFIPLGAFAASSSSSSVPTASSTALYQNKEFGFGMRIPKGWKIQESEEMLGNVRIVVYFVSPKESATDSFAEQVNVVFEALPEPTELTRHDALTLKEYGDLSIDYLKTAKGFRLISRKPSKAFGNSIPTETFSYLANSGVTNARMMVKQDVAVIENLGMVFTLRATPLSFRRYERTFDAMVKSFTFNVTN